MEPDDHQSTPRFQKLLESNERGTERKVVDRGNRRNEIKLAVGKWVCHHISLDKFDGQIRAASAPGPGDDVVVNIDCSHLVTTLRHPCRKQAQAASHIESTPAAWHGQSQHEIVIVNIVIPPAESHR
jgi:hypothetical protein